MRSSRIALATAIALTFFAPQAVAEEVEESSTQIVEAPVATAGAEAPTAAPAPEGSQARQAEAVAAQQQAVTAEAQAQQQAKARAEEVAARSTAEAQALLAQDEALAAQATAMEVAGELFLLVAGDEVVELDGGGAERSRTPVGERVTAVDRIGDTLLLGRADGTIGHVSGSTGEPLLERGFEEPPSSRVTRIAATLSGLVAAGYADGQLVIWNVEDGVRLLVRNFRR